MLQMLMLQLIWPELCIMLAEKLIEYSKLTNPIHMPDSEQATCMPRVGQNHIHVVYIRYFWQGKHSIYGRIRCVTYGSGQPH